MLVLSRRPDEELVLDGNIIITVLEVRGNQIRLGISAPPAVTVLRRELLDRKAGEVASSCLP
jgi:carbon storage regulator